MDEFILQVGCIFYFTIIFLTQFYVESEIKFLRKSSRVDMVHPRQAFCIYSWGTLWSAADKKSTELSLKVGSKPQSNRYLNLKFSGSICNCLNSDYNCDGHIFIYITVSALLNESSFMLVNFLISFNIHPPLYRSTICHYSAHRWLKTPHVISLVLGH